MSVEVKRASSEEIPNLRLPEFREVDCLETDLDMEVFVVPTISSAKIPLLRVQRDDKPRKRGALLP